MASMEDEINPSNDPICCIVASDKILLITRESGALQRYALPNIALTNKYTLQTKPHKLALNCNSTCLSIIDVTGLLQFLDLDGTHGGGLEESQIHSGGGREGELIRFERKD